MEIITKLTGVLVNDAQINLKEIDRGSKEKRRNHLVLVREPDNPYDINAIRVETNGKYLGYLPKRVAKDIATRIDEGSQFVISRAWMNKSRRYEIIGMTVEINEVPSGGMEEVPISRDPANQFFNNEAPEYPCA
ncbi:MAG: hypothetical protein CVU57_06455 [Deltaproteobacteria bacterium HGW-Deltaproteobacteria-15]|jgi:hypothetical protein|nr:MAG: hypothetical protein CVU57_06455 [Deltaproteobacteria bacterium HGW-Deltaproteobacteria-15]